jgi:ATP-binding cassette subfamily B protein
MQEKKLKPAGTLDIFRVYWDHARKYRKSLAFALFGVVLIQAGMLAAPLYLRQFFNILANNTPSPDLVPALISILIVVGSMYVIEWAGRRIQEWGVMYFETHTMRDLSASAFGYLIDHSHNFFISNFSGSLTHKVTKFSRSFERLADVIVLQFIPTTIFVVGATIVLGTRHLALGIALFAWTVLFVWFQIKLAQWRQPYRVAVAEADTKVTGTLADAIGNQSNITLFAGQTLERELFGKVLHTWRVAVAKLWVTDGWIWAGIGLFMIGIEMLLFYLAIQFWQQGLLTVGDFVLIQAYLLTTFDRLVAINRDLRGFYSSLADGGEMVAILQAPHEIRDRKSAKPIVVGEGEVWFDNVNFYFNKLRPVLKDFNFTIVGGERVALVGPSGAGKSTVTKLLLRLYDLPEGEIKIDKQDIAKVTQESLRNAISFVPQEPVLFHRTLMDNIRYGRRDATDEEVIEAAKKAHCHEFISELQHGYDTYVGERGVKLSGGERQRVAIARAILKDAPILVLDEATSSLDSESEALIQDALETLMKGKTVVVIAHRLSTIMKMDRIVVMAEGRVVAQGTHLELIRERGLYQKLWSIQAGGFIGGDEDDEEAPRQDTEPDDDLLAEGTEDK